MGGDMVWGYVDGGKSTVVAWEKEREQGGERENGDDEGDDEGGMVR